MLGPATLSAAVGDGFRVQPVRRKRYSEKSEANCRPRLHYYFIGVHDGESIHAAGFPEHTDSFENCDLTSIVDRCQFNSGIDRLHIHVQSDGELKRCSAAKPRKLPQPEQKRIFGIILNCRAFLSLKHFAWALASDILT